MITTIIVILGIIFVVSVLATMENLLFGTDLIGCLVVVGGIAAFAYFAFLLLGG